MESDTPVSLTTESGLFYTGENEYTIAVDGEITVTFDGDWGLARNTPGITGWN